MFRWLMMFGLAGTASLCTPSRATALDLPGGLPFRVAWAARAATPPVIDGVITAEDGWDAAAPLTDFTVLQEDNTRAAPAEGRLLYDDEALFIAVRAGGPGRGTIKMRETKRDAAVNADDCVHLFIVPPDAPPLRLEPQPGRWYFHLSVNALGTQRDTIGYKGKSWWNGQWEAKTSVQDDGWTVEFRLPYSTFGVDGPSDRAWHFNICRRYTTGENATYANWSPYEHWYSQSKNHGRIVFGEGAPNPDEIAIDFVRRELTVDLDRARLAIARAQRDLRAASEVTIRRGELTAALDPIRVRNQALRRELDSLAPADAEAGRKSIGSRIDRLLDDALAAERAANAYRLRARTNPDWPFVVLGGPAITDARFERGRPFPPEFRTADRLRLSACRGEYEPTTFVLYTDEPRANVRVTATDLKGREGTIPSVAVDLRVVKYWYQAGDFGKPEGRLPAYDIAMLLPELLLKDDNLVVVNHEQRKNYMRIDGELVDVTDPTPEFNVEGWPAVENPRLQNLAPKDAATLLPFDVGADEIKQVFVTVHVPDKAAAGTYKGEIEVTAGPHGSLKLPMTVNVYPFDLAPCPIDYSIYTRSFIDDAPKVPCFSEQKTPEQYRAEMANLFAHGIVNPQVNDIKFERFEQAMRIREEVGMPKGHIYHHGVRIPRDELDSDEALAKWEARIRRFSTWAREHGYGSFYAYAIDEADPLLHKQRRWIEAAHRAGGKVFVSVEDDAGFFEIAGDVLDLPIMSGPVQPRIARLVQKNGHRLGIYAFPQVTWEKPEIFRRNYGIRLWLAGYDVEMTYAYQHSFGHIWNDFDYKGDYKDHCLAYPTVNGVVDTLVFEGLREAVDDTRYIATFLTESKHPDHPAEVAASADKWLHSLDPEQDLHEMRRKIATAIIRAMQERGARQVKRVAGHR